VFIFTLNLALSQSLVVQRNSSIDAVQKRRATPHGLPADAKRVDTASERISVCRGTECRIQIPVDEEADRRTVSYTVTYVHVFKGTWLVR